jgi:hypothetical protein
VSVRYSAHDLGASPQYSQVLTEVFEVNLRETKSLLDLDCFEYEGAGGVVGGWDYSYRSRSRLSCSWKSELQDLFCVEQLDTELRGAADRCSVEGCWVQ